MSLHILGLNHTTAPVEIREQLIFGGNDVPRALSEVTQLPGVSEAVVLSTCNRTEFFVDASSEGVASLRAWLIEDQKLSAAAQDALFLIEGEAGIRHLFRVACGLDSMVLGEPQILGQLKDAWREAERAGTVGQQLGRLFRHGFSVAKKVRTETEIGSSPVSVAYAAVSLAGQFFSAFARHTALLVGAGATIDLVAQHLHGKGIGRLFVANRDLERARALAARFGGFAVPLSELDGMLPDADILVSSTASPHPIITLEHMQEAIRLRRRKPIFAVDIAVPRDLDAAIADLADVYLYTIDDLAKVVVEGQSAREAAAVAAGRILDDEIRRYLEIERSKAVAPVITALRDRGDALRREVLRQGLRRLNSGADAETVIEYVAGSLLKKLLHEPTVRLREAGEASDQAFIEATQQLFGLHDGKDE
ncbi:MAG TPA: glutamyl-tRNA reductase [Woeseiaceae bacterium]|jgi:glutamyl-tRNA reductase|nr:glutamyl-tRNA reductase [Woeseiaceae bacterium]